MVYYRNTKIYSTDKVDETVHPPRKIPIAFKRVECDGVIAK